MTYIIPRPFAVLCVRHDGGEREFARYATREEAQRVVDQLVRVGCTSRVAGPDDLPLALQGQPDA